MSLRDYSSDVSAVVPLPCLRQPTGKGVDRERKISLKEIRPFGLSRARARERPEFPAFAKSGADSFRDALIASIESNTNSAFLKLALILLFRSR